MGTQLFTNQFGQSVVVGNLDLDIMRTGRIAGILSPNQGSAVVAGSPAKIDTTIAYTPGSVINFLQAAENDLAFGFFTPTVQNFTFASGVPTPVQVAGMYGPVMWMLANATITPGATVYSDSTGTFVTVTASSSKARGIALDYAVNGQALRVMITNPLAIAS
jgi:Uncharacterized conserved protein (DUF2190)